MKINLHQVDLMECVLRLERLEREAKALAKASARTLAIMRDLQAKRRARR